MDVAKELIQIGAYPNGAGIDVPDLIPAARTVSRNTQNEYQTAKSAVMEELKQVC